MPLDSVLLKPAGPDCDLACTYCFYRPKSSLFPPGSHRMSPEVLEAAVKGAMAASGPHVSFGWQGGEPTLMGLPFFERAVGLEERHGSGKSVANGLQTSGMHLDRPWAAFLKRYRFLVGLSIDGPAEVHDRYRSTAGGGPTWARARDAALLLLNAGVPVNALTVVNDVSVHFPHEIYGHHRDLGLEHMQFIPCLEPGPDGSPASFSVPAGAYGAFLCTLFDLWLADFRNGAPTTSIRFFESLLLVHAGLPPQDCTLLETCGAYLVVEHNGDVFPCDFFVEPGWKLGNVLEQPLGEIFSSDRNREFGAGKSALPGECIACPWLSRCRGGCTRDRRDGRGMSFFCPSFKMLFEHADAKLGELVEQHRRKEDEARHHMRAAASGKTGRNDPCPCGSGLKFKRCCGG